MLRKSICLDKVKEGPETIVDIRLGLGAVSYHIVAVRIACAFKAEQCQMEFDVILLRQLQVVFGIGVEFVRECLEVSAAVVET